MKNPTKIVCVIVTYNRTDFLITCVKSLLREATDSLDVGVIIIDNGSTENYQTVMKDIDSQEVEYYKNPQNLPLPIALNKGLEKGLQKDTDYLLLLNDDIEFQPGAFEHMLQLALRTPKSLVSPMQVNYRNPKELDQVFLGQIKTVDKLIVDAVYHNDLQEEYEVPTIIGAAIFASKETLLDLGDFDTLFSFYGIDDDYCNRARFLNYKLLLATKAIMYHAHGKLMDAPKVDKNAWFRRWKSNFRARMLHKLKAPNQSLSKSYFQVGFYVLDNFFKSMMGRFPKGAFAGIGIYFDLLMKINSVGKRRKKDFHLN